MNTILHNPEYLKALYPKESTYYRISVFFSILIWILIIVGTFGIGLFYVLFFAFFLIIGHAIFLAYIKGYGIQIDEEQFPEIYTLAKDISSKLGMPTVPDIYLYNMDGIFNAFATHFFSRNFIILTTSILDACKEEEKNIEFILAHEMTHLQRGHTRSQFFLFPSKLVPWLGNAYSRACEYSCDGVAGKFILDNRKNALEGVLLLPTADAKRAQQVNIEAFERQRSKSGGFWMTLVQTGSTHPYSFNRVAYIRGLFGDEIQTIKQSFFGRLLAPLFSLGGGNGAQVLIVIAIIGIFAAALFPALRGYMERSRQMNMERSTYDDSESYESDDDTYYDEYYGSGMELTISDSGSENTKK